MLLPTEPCWSVRNSETLLYLDQLLAHLPDSHRAELVQVVQSFQCLFSDVPDRTHLIKNGINVGNAKPIKQKLQINVDIWMQR